MKKILIFSGILIFISAQPASAIDEKDVIKQRIQERVEKRIENKMNITTTSVELKNRLREKIQNQGIINQVKNRVQELIQKKLKFAARVNGNITGISDNQLTIKEKEGKSFRVIITDKTQLRRRFWGKSNLNEFQVGDEVNVIGRYTNEEKTEIEAKLIRNLSIQKRWGVFFGRVISVSDNFLVIETTKRNQLTIYVSENTKLINRKEEKINFSDIKTGHRIRVKGVWDKNLKEVRLTDEIKDFSLPTKES